MDRRVTHLHVNRSLNCVIEVVQMYLHNYISPTLVILAAFVFPFYHYYLF